MNRKGVGVYLLVTLGLGYTLTPLLVYFNLIAYQEPNILNMALFLAVMWIPALGALIASKASPDAGEGATFTPLWPVPMNRMLCVALLTPFWFALSYAICAFWGWTHVQWDMGTLMNIINAGLQQPMTKEVAAIAPKVFLVGGIAMNIVLGLTFYAVLALGSEWGWRAYLLPQLMGLGRYRAYMLTGLLWALWAFPLVFGGFWRRDALHELPLFMLRFTALCVVLSVLLGEVLRRYRNIGLVSLCAGAFAAQFFGVWEYLFPISTAPYTGPFGLVSIVIWAVISLAPILLLGPGKSEDVLTETPEQEAA